MSSLCFILTVCLFVVAFAQTNETNENPISKWQWQNIDISLPKAESQQVVGYYPKQDRVYLLGGKNMEEEYWSLQFNKSFDGWSKNQKLRFEDLRIAEYTQSYYSSKNNVLYIKTNRFIHIFDMEIEYFNMNVIELPEHLSNACLTVYYEASNENIEYLIIVGSKTQSVNQAVDAPTTWIYKVDQSTHNITFFDIGPDLLGTRKNHCCVVMDGYLLIVGGMYDEKQTSFVEEWKIDIDTAYGDANSDAAVQFNDFTRVNTMINKEIAASSLPQWGHRCAVNELTNQLFVVGGIIDENEEYFNYSRYVLVLERFNNTLYEMNYRETLQEEQQEEANGDDIHSGKVLPSLPMEIAYTAVLIDKYGYLNVFGGELNSGMPTDAWLRLNLKGAVVDGTNVRENDVIWKNHRKHNHNEQWALMSLLILIILIVFFFKCVSKMGRLRSDKKKGINAVYDEITASEDIDNDLEDTEENDEYASDEINGMIMA